MKINKKDTIRLITRVAIFGAISIILYMVPGFQFSLPFAPAFLKIHFDEIPVLLSGFAFGTPTAILIIILKGMFKLIQDIPQTLGVGVVADIIYGIALVVPATLIYCKNRNFNGALLGCFCGVLLNLIFSCLIGLYTIFPLYGFIYGENTIISMFNVFDNSIDSITDIKIAYRFLLPFNLIKDSIILVVTFIVYKPMRIVIERIKK